MTPLATPLDALLDDLAESPSERRTMRAALELLAYAVDEAAPSPSLKEKVLARVRAPERPASFEYRGDYFARGDALSWLPIAPGIRIKLLHEDAATGARTVLVEMAPDLLFPEHPHPAIEDLYLIGGDAYVGDQYMRAGDYCRANAGTTHSDVRSGPSGSLALVISR